MYRMLTGLLLSLLIVGVQADKEKKPEKSITVRFNITLDSESQITVDEQPCSLTEVETLYKFAPGALIMAEMKVMEGKATLLKVVTKK